MTTVLESYREFISGGDPSIRELFLLRSITPMATIISLYLLFVTHLGPLLMKNRKPIELRRLIVIYNFSLVIYYMYFIAKGLVFMYKLGFSTFCNSTLNSRQDALIAEFYRHGYGLYIVRFVELLDTVFLILSKKFKMITPLHVFHHSVVPAFGWFGFRSEKGTYLSLFMGVNSFVHIIMYTYYAVAALGPEYKKYLWWKKYLTILQILQFLVMTFYILIMSAIGCATSKVTLISSIVLTVLFFHLFIKYYRRTFIESKKAEHKNGAPITTLSSSEHKNGAITTTPTNSTKSKKL